MATHGVNGLMETNLMFIRSNYVLKPAETNIMSNTIN